MLIDKLDAILVLLAHDDVLGFFQHHAKERADSRGACSDDENGIVLGDLGDLRRPIARGKNVAHEQSLSIGHGIGNLVEPLIRKWHANVLCLTAIDAAAKRPTAVLVGAVVDEAFLAEEALAAESFNVDCNSIAGLYVHDCRADLFHDADHLVTDSDSFHRSRHAAVFDMQVA